MSPMAGSVFGAAAPGLPTYAGPSTCYRFDADSLCSATMPSLSSDDGITYHIRWASAGKTSYTVAPETVPVQGEFSVLHQDDEVIVVEKPAFLPTENTATIKDSVRQRVELLIAKDGSSAANEELQPTARRVFLPHRLDWETSGLVVLALSSAAMRSLSRQFAERTVHKVYVADVLGRPPAATGLVDLALSPDPDRRPMQRVDLGGKSSKTNWEEMSPAEPAAGPARQSRLRLIPESGRRHQLRMHCLAIGCAIVGDGLYVQTPPCEPSASVGDACRSSYSRERLHLHAAELGFAHPRSGVWMEFQSRPPF